MSGEPSSHVRKHSDAGELPDAGSSVEIRIAERISKRAAKKQEIQQKAEGHKRAVRTLQFLWMRFSLWFLIGGCTLRI